MLLALTLSTMFTALHRYIERLQGLMFKGKEEVNSDDEE
jgi:hypothetical protein